MTLQDRWNAWLRQRIGTPAYSAGSGAETHTMAGGRRYRHVSVYANGVDTTLVIKGGNTITIRSGTSFTVDLDGYDGNDVSTIVVGANSDWYISWMTPPTEP